MICDDDVRVIDMTFGGTSKLRGMVEEGPSFGIPGSRGPRQALCHFLDRVFSSNLFDVSSELS